MEERIFDRPLRSGAEHSIYEMKFRRKFSVNPYKTMRLPLGEMSFYKDWLHTDRGDPYPVTWGAADAPLTEKTADGSLDVTGEGARARLLGQHFPYASYEIALDTLENGAAGFMIYAAPGETSKYTEETAPRLFVYLTREGDGVRLAHEMLVGGVSRGVVTEESVYPFVPGMRFLISCRGRWLDVYINAGSRPVPCKTLDLHEFSVIHHYGTFVSATASLYYALSGGRLRTHAVSFFLDGGVSHADMKPIRYEDGMPILSDGRLFFTMSSRMESGGFQSILSWNPSTSEFRLEGALFFDCGDGFWCSDVAASILYHRERHEWLLWAVAFSHGHILMHGTSIADPRYGINVIDMTLMETETQHEAAADAVGADFGAYGTAQKAALSDDRLWLAKSGDEDPDFLYDRDTGKWYMTICRLVEENGKNRYRYFLYESDEPFAGYRFLSQSRDGETTGGSMVRVGGKLYFTCGSRFDARAQYDVYELPDFSTHRQILCDYDDGGFRGWGTVIPVPCGSRTKYMWITFDRHNGGYGNWTYGNLYVYEADRMNSGYERGITYQL